MEDSDDNKSAGTESETDRGTQREDKQSVWFHISAKSVDVIQVERLYLRCAFKNKNKRIMREKFGIAFTVCESVCFSLSHPHTDHLTVELGV